MYAVILRPHSASSNCPLRSLNRLDFLVPRIAEQRWLSLNPLSQELLVPHFWSTFSFYTLYSSFRQSFACLCLSIPIVFYARWQPFWTVQPIRSATQMLK